MPGRYDDRAETVLRPQQGGALRRHRPELTWSDDRGARREVLEGRVVAGSAAGAELLVADATVSRIHAELDPRDDGLWVTDLGSRNGTYVNGVRVASALVPDGGEVLLGSARIVTRYQQQASAVELWPFERFGPILGRSSAMRELFSRLSRIAGKDSTVMIFGETGTGKELVAQAIHEASPRAKKPFIVVDCAALPESLFESELFGHAKGAFTGAIADREGAFEAADGGTLFLDEIGELPLAMQPKLLRVLESRTVRPLGQSVHKKVDVRVLSATHRDLRAMVNAGAFREDLYFRLAVLPAVVPPLRERPDDIPLLIQHFRGSAVDPATATELQSKPWLGNVRELRNFVERAEVLGHQEALAESPPRPSGAGMSLPFDKTFKEMQESVEREYLRVLLERTGRNVNRVAELAGIDRTYVYRLMRRYGL